MRVFITGSTGFLGFHIAKSCISKGYEVLCLKRKSSVSLFDTFQEKQVIWVNSDTEDWKDSVVCFNPDVLIHCAWSGVSADSRNDFHLQHQNINLSGELFKLFPYKQIIVLGSQDEYGRIDSLVDEDYPLTPLTEYGKAKIATCKLLQECCGEKKIEWQWIRVFTVYGDKQKDDWLIPSMIRKCLNPQVLEMETTRGEQTYSYLYSEDFANAILSMIGAKGKSGIYNLSSSVPTRLKDLFNLIKQKTNSKIMFNPVLPYREYQSMMIIGDSSKFKAAFGEYESISLDKGLENIIQTIND